MRDWAEKHEADLVDALNNCEITRKEFDKQMRDMADELRWEAEEAAAEAYENVMQGW